VVQIHSPRPLNSGSHKITYPITVRSGATEFRNARSAISAYVRRFGQFETKSNFLCTLLTELFSSIT
jgi:hypothetical protein